MCNRLRGRISAMRLCTLLVLILLGSVPHSCSRKSGKLPKARTRRTNGRNRAGGVDEALQAALVHPSDPVLSSHQHSLLGSARAEIQADMVAGVQAYAKLAQSALAAGELSAAGSVLTEGLAVVDAAGAEADFLAASLLVVQASVHKCNGKVALALEAFDRMSELLPTSLGHDPHRQEGVRRLFRLDLLRILMNEIAAKRDDKQSKARWSGLNRRRKTEEQALLADGPWKSLDQLPRDYQPGLRARAWWNLDEDGVLEAPGAPAKLLEALQTVRHDLIKEYKGLARAGNITPERECIHSRSEGFGEWLQLDFLGPPRGGGASTGREQTTHSTTSLLSRRQCERGLAPAGCAAVEAVEAVLQNGGWGTVRNVSTRSPVVLRAGYSAVEPGTWIRPHYGETNAQLKLHFGLIVPTDSNDKPCAKLRVGINRESVDADRGLTYADPNPGEWRGWSEGGLLLFDDSFEHEVRVQRPKNATRPPDGFNYDSNGRCAETRLVLQLVLRHPDLRDS